MLEGKKGESFGRLDMEDERRMRWRLEEIARSEKKKGKSVWVS